MTEKGLCYISQHALIRAVDFAEHKAQYLTRLEQLVAFQPNFINSHTGRDFFTFEQNLELIDAIAEISDAFGIPVIHETHRGRFPFHGAVTKPFLDARPNLRLTADFSHWCNASESLLEGQEEIVAAAIERIDHIHARVGHEQGPQIGDPRAPEWQPTVEVFLGWWDRIVETKRAAGAETLTICCEFGPWPYTIKLPFTQKEIASQWDINVYMLGLLRERHT